MIRRTLWLISAACFSALLLVAPIAQAQQQPGVEFAVEPGPKSQTARGGGYFRIKAAPGEVVRQSIVLRNESGRPLTLALAAVDAVTGQVGGASYGVPQDAVERTGAWIELTRTTVDLDRGEATIVPFDVTVPSDATSGEHLAGLAVGEVAEEGKQGGNDEAVSVVVNTRRIIAVQVDVPGPKVPELVITGVVPAARPDGLYLEIGIENQGTAMTSGEGTIEVPSQAFLQDFAVDTFIPATSIGYPIKWTDDPREGEYEAAVEIEYDGRTAAWSGSFTVGDPVLEDLEDRGVEVAGGFPFVLVGTVVGLLAAGFLVLILLRRRNRGPAFVPAPKTQPSARATYPPVSTYPPTQTYPSTAPSDAPRTSPQPRYPTSGPPPPPPPPKKGL